MIYILILSIEQLFAPWMFTYQIIIMLATSTLLTVDKNKQTLVERLNKLFAGYYHADCTANHKYVPERCFIFYNVLYLSLSRSAISTEGMTVHQITERPTT